MKFFTMIGYAKSAKLIDPEGNSFPPFEAFKKKLIDDRSVALGTANDYLGHAARFVDYIYAISQVGMEPTQQNLEVIIASYESYLLHAQSSSNPISQMAALLTGRVKQCSPASLTVIEAALKQFLTLSDSIARANGEDGLFSRYLPYVLTKLNAREASRLRGGSMLGGVIRGGAKQKRRSGRLFHATKRQPNFQTYSGGAESNFEFPLNKITELIGAARTYRDKSLYALLAASGIRGSEGLQIRPEDINIEKREVYINNPFKRTNPGIRECEYELLKWKGRNNAETFLLEPYASMFFDALSDYFRYEYIPNQGHPFIFQTLSGEDRGRPLFAGNRNTRIRQFKKLALSIGVRLTDDVIIHSLRHSYGIYMLNYLPTPTGFGMPIAMLANVMGHSSIDNTKIYARHDKEIVRTEVEYANKIILGTTNLTRTEMLIQYHRQRISDLEGK